MKTFGIIGIPLSHSFSPSYFNQKFKKLNIDAQYHSFLLNNATFFPSLIEKHSNLKGLNVTIPFKEKIINYLDELDDVARKINAVNTITIKNIKGKKYLKGYNTDVFGFEKSIKKFFPLDKKLNTLILGTGGASKAVAYVLKKQGVSFRLVSQNPKENHQLSYKQLTKEIINSVSIIINTTPLGMFPNVSSFPPIPYKYVCDNHHFIDLNYNPSETVFLKKAKHRGAKTMNGHQMLIYQAEKAWDIFFQNNPTESLNL